MTIEEKILKTITPHVKTVVSNTSLYTERNVKSVMRKIAWEAFKQGEKEAIKKDIIKGKEDLKLFNKHTRINKVGLQNKYEELPAAPTVLPLIKVPRKSPLNPNGKGKSGLTLHAIIVHKPIDLHKAREIARDIMKIKKDKFMRETKSSYRFRNVPKTKFSSFVTKVLNPQVSLVLGHLK